MLITKNKACTSATRDSLSYTASRPQVIEAIEAQDADSSALITILVAPKGSDTLGAALAQESATIPGGQVFWSGALTLLPDQEIRAYFDYATLADRLFLTMKVRA